MADLTNASADSSNPYVKVSASLLFESKPTAVGLDEIDQTNAELRKKMTYEASMFNHCKPYLHFADCMLAVASCPHIDQETFGVMVLAASKYIARGVQIQDRIAQDDAITDYCTSRIYEDVRTELDAVILRAKACQDQTKEAFDLEDAQIGFFTAPEEIKTTLGVEKAKLNFNTIIPLLSFLYRRLVYPNNEELQKRIRHAFGVGVALAKVMKDCPTSFSCIELYQSLEEFFQRARRLQQPSTSNFEEEFFTCLRMYMNIGFTTSDRDNH